MQALIEHARAFHRSASAGPDRLAGLADGQTPQALFVTCSDSRLVPAVITGAEPGDLFELRTAGNVVPPYDPEQPSGEAATVEYAVEVLEVPDVVVCGHSHCGAVGALARGDDLGAVPAVRGWLARHASVPQAEAAPPPELAEAVQAHVLAQMQRLRAHPSVARRLADGRLRLHGWFYRVHTGLVLAYDRDADAFLPL